MRAIADIKSMSWYQKAIALKGQSFGEYYYEDLIVRKDYMIISRSFHLQKDMEGVLMILVDLKRIKNMIEMEPFDLFLLDSELKLLTSQGDFVVGQNLSNVTYIVCILSLFLGNK